MHAGPKVANAPRRTNKKRGQKSVYEKEGANIRGFDAGVKISHCSQFLRCLLVKLGAIASSLTTVFGVAMGGEK